MRYNYYIACTKRRSRRVLDKQNKSTSAVNYQNHGNSKLETEIRMQNDQHSDDK